MNRKVRIGLLVDSHTVHHWAYAMLERIMEDGFAEISLVITNQSQLPPTKGIVGKLKDNYGQLLYLAWLKIEGALYRPINDPFAQKDLRQLLPDVPELPVEPRQKKYSDYFSRDDTEQIASYELDVLIRLGFRILRGDILHCARLGVWSYHHGDNDCNRGGRRFMGSTRRLAGDRVYSASADRGLGRGRDPLPILRADRLVVAFAQQSCWRNLTAPHY